jgi:dGTPase
MHDETIEDAERCAPVDFASGRRRSQWAATMAGRATDDGSVLAHADSDHRIEARTVDRLAREEAEAAWLCPGATRAVGAGQRARPEPPDAWRTCFERDRDRILHAAAFRRLAGKTQVFVFPADHQRTRLTHALEVAQVATAVARSIGLNVALVEAMALGHDCGHGPGGHASEDAFGAYLPDFHHAPWGADVVLTPLNLCEETLDGIRHHSWSQPAPSTPEGELLSWADRCAYCAHDLEDAVAAGLVDPEELPAEVAEVVGTTRAAQLRSFITALVDHARSQGRIGMAADAAGALAALRAFNYERIYMRPASVDQAEAVVRVLRGLVDLFVDQPHRLPAGWAAALPEGADPVRSAVAYVAGMTDRFAFDLAVELLGWDPDRLPRGIDSPRR